jgi:hypothetical protein
MNGGNWGPIRRELAEIYTTVGSVEMAAFINPN